MSPYYPTLKPFVTHNTKQYIPTNQTSQSRFLPLNLKLFPHKYSHSASQSRDWPLNLAIIPHKYSHSSFQSRDLPHSLSPSRSRSPSRAVAHALDLPLTRYVSLSLHVQLVGIFVCKFVIFMHNLILSFDLEINLILGFDQFS